MQDTQNDYQDIREAVRALTAAVASYEVGIRVGEFLGRSHDKIFHTTATVGTLAETSFKYHASCRHTHPAADALQILMRHNQLGAGDIASIEALVHQSALDVLGPVINPATVHQSKFSMGTVLGLIALKGRAGQAEFDAALDDPAMATWRERTTMTLDPEMDQAYPQRWIGPRSGQAQRPGRCLGGRGSIGSPATGFARCMEDGPGRHPVHGPPQLRAARWAATSWAIPPSASTSMLSSWARVNVASSPVPCTSTKAPEPVMTTLTSASQAASSS